MDTSSPPDHAHPYTARKVPPTLVPLAWLLHPSELKYHFSGKEGATKFFYVHENFLMKTKTEEGKVGNLVACSDGEAFEYYFDNFTGDSAPNEDPDHSRR